MSKKAIPSGSKALRAFIAVSAVDVPDCVDGIDEYISRLPKNDRSEFFACLKKCIQFNEVRRNGFKQKLDFAKVELIEAHDEVKRLQEENDSMKRELVVLRRNYDLE